MQSGNKKAIFGWCMYDWANSAFTTTVMANFFPIFFKEYWSADVETTISTARLGFANSIAGIVVALLAPILGAVADRGSIKKKFLLFFVYMGVIMTMALYFISEGQWLLAIFIYVFATIGFSGANIFYDALLIAVASEKKMELVSSLAYALGYLGGGILFAINVWMARSPTTFGFMDASAAVKFSFLTVGIWWAVFSIPIFLFVKEPTSNSFKTDVSILKAGFIQLRNTFKQIRHLKVVFLFLIAYFLYIDGVDTIVRMAVDYGLSIGFEFKHLIVALLITQFIGFPCAIAFGYIGEKIGAKRTIYITIAVYTLIPIWGAFMQNHTEFYILAAIIGVVQGGIQALSRSFYAKIIPADKAAEFFGFYNMIGKFSVVFGPALIGGVGLLIRAMGVTSNLASRISITSVSLLFIAGGIIFYFVSEAEGKQKVQYL